MYLNKSEACERIGLQEWVLDAFIRDDQIKALKVDDGSVLFRSEDVDALGELVFTKKTVERPVIETTSKGNGVYETQSLAGHFKPADPTSDEPYTLSGYLGDKPFDGRKKKGIIIRPDEVGTALQIIASRCRLSISVGKEVTSKLGWVTREGATIYLDHEDRTILHAAPFKGGPVGFYGNGSKYGQGERGVPMVIRVTVHPSGRIHIPMSRRPFTVHKGGRLSISIPEDIRKVLW